jgi:8-oxo-dGTP diphosphatase
MNLPLQTAQRAQAIESNEKSGGFRLEYDTPRFHHATVMPHTPILATLGYVLSPDRRRVLMIHRNIRDDDLHLGKYNGLGGKLEANEDVAAGMCRELREEAGMEVIDLTLRGTISWPGFGRQGEDWFGFLFLVTRFGGALLERNPEGTLEWIEIDRVEKLPLWEGDRHFLPLVFDADPRPFHGVMPYRDGRMLSWAYSRI